MRTRHIVILGMLEGLVICSAVLRMVIPSLGLDLSKQPHLIWFIATMLVAGAAVSHYVLRAALLMPRVRAGEQVDDELKQILGISVSLVGLAALVSLAGPALFERFLG